MTHYESTAKPDQALHDLLVQAQERVGADRCTLYEVDTAAREVHSRVALGLDPGTIIRLPLHRGVVGYVARTGQSINLRDAYNDPRFDRGVDRATGYRTRSILSVPVRDPARPVRVIGVLQALNKPERFTEEDEQELVRCAEEAAPWLARPA